MHYIHPSTHYSDEPEILERIRSDQTISEPVRKQALVLAERYRKT